MQEKACGQHDSTLISSGTPTRSPLKLKGRRSSTLFLPFVVNNLLYHTHIGVCRDGSRESSTVYCNPLPALPGPISPAPRPLSAQLRAPQSSPRRAGLSVVRPKSHFPPTAVDSASLRAIHPDLCNLLRRPKWPKDGTAPGL